MKILYAVQGTGNGHITRAIEIIPYLQQKGDVDILVSGIQSDIELPFKVKYRFKGMSFIFGKKGGVDFWKTFKKLSSLKLLKEIKNLDLKPYDLIISDFEPISCWAAIKAKKECIGLSNQVATLHPLAPRPKKHDIIGKLVLQNYAPTTYNYGFHFKRLDGSVFTQIIRIQVRELIPTDQGHYTVYLPSYDDDQIIKYLRLMYTVNWQVFSKHYKKGKRIKNVTTFPIDSELFLKSIASSKGVLCNAGFGTVSESLFLKKKVMVIPMKKQFEQACNAALLKEMGIPVIKKLNLESISNIKKWLIDDTIIEVDYPDNAKEIVDLIVDNHTGNKKINAHHQSNNYSIFQ
jgi:uncharacterized protein (TIGR00661 family)